MQKPQFGDVLSLTSHQMGGKIVMLMMTEANIWDKITTYVAENREKTALEAEIEQEVLIENAYDDFQYTSIEN